MAAIIDFFKNLFSFLGAINANAFFAIYHILSKNWLIILSTISIGILLYTEISIKNSELIDDQRDIY